MQTDQENNHEKNWSEWFQSPFIAARSAIDAAGVPDDWKKVVGVISEMTKIETVASDNFMEDLLKSISESTGIAIEQDSINGMYRATFNREAAVERAETIEKCELKYFKTLVRYEVISAGSPFTGSLDDLTFEVGEGDMSGRMLSKTPVPITAEEARRHLHQNHDDPELLPGLVDEDEDINSVRETA